MWTLLSLAAAGVLAGALGRWLLHRLGMPIPPPWCEICVAALWIASGWRPVPLAVAWFGVLLSASDLVRQRLPNALTLAAYPVVLLALTPEPVVLLRAAVFLALHALVWVLTPAAMGAGDVKLSGVVGLVLGSWSALAVGALLASVVTLVLAVTLRRRCGVPHGPGMLAAAWLLSVTQTTSGMPAPV
jgi:leader peptidase (prepilin peptidase) / N-methyltransferase